MVDQWTGKWTESIVEGISMKYWIYAIGDDTYGIVKADTEEKAKQKVLKAYTKHGGYESEITEDMIEIESINNHWFADNPDVIEVCCTG